MNLSFSQWFSKYKSRNSDIYHLISGEISVLEQKDFHAIKIKDSNTAIMHMKI